MKSQNNLVAVLLEDNNGIEYFITSTSLAAAVESWEELFHKDEPGKPPKRNVIVSAKIVARAGVGVDNRITQLANFRKGLEDMADHIEKQAYSADMTGEPVERRVASLLRNLAKDLGNG